jgi:hypothetical protein
MPKADVAPLPALGPGFGCNCPAFRFGEPTPEQAAKALANSANVTVQLIGVDSDGQAHFCTWTQPDHRYETVWDPAARRAGWCKHSIACLAHWAPWHRQLALGADALIAEAGALRAQVKKLEREAKKHERRGKA